MQLTVRELCSAVNGTLLYGEESTSFEFVSTDSRKAMTTELFIPLRGENMDGHRYIENALENGAVGFLTEEENAPTNASFAVKVKDTTLALGDLAAYVLKNSNATVIGITGSVGKTTTRQFVASVVSELGKTVSTSGNFNNHIGLPLTILGMDGDEKFAVLEMGMNHFGEISYLSRIARPDIGIITMIGTSHIEFLGSRENILKAKAELTDGMDNNGILLLNGDNDLLSQYQCDKKIYYFGKENAHYPYEVISISEECEFLCDGFCYRIPASGEHNIQNASAAILLGKLLGATDAQIQAGLSAFQSVGLRQKTEMLSDITVILDCYNASLDSDKAALAVLKNANGKRKVAVLGPIGELGDYRKPILEAVGEAVFQEQIDHLICVEAESDFIRDGAINAGMNAENITYLKDKEAFYEKIPQLFQPGDIVLFKASRKYRFEELYEKLKQFKLENKE